MANTTQAETAKIYQFPLTARTTSRHGQPPEATLILDRKFNHFADAAFGSGWYHDAAIESERTPKS